MTHGLAAQGQMTTETPSPEKTSPGVKRRIRARKSCEPCRDRKRKCDGGYPCDSCVRFQYSCHYVSVQELRKSKHAPHVTSTALSETPPARPATSVASKSQEISPNDQIESLEANSGAVFMRKLALALDPANAPRSHLFAWNLFLGARKSEPCHRSFFVPEIISRATMEHLARVYLDKVDPCYGFIDHDILRQQIHSRWEPYSLGDAYDAVLCGVAALGYLFSNIHLEDAESALVNSARQTLEQSPDAQPGIDVVTGWVLRVAYLRMTAPPHLAWMASCTTMHAIEASGAHLSRPTLAAGSPTDDSATSDLWKRIIGVARHLNTWISFDLGRSRIVLPNSEIAMPSVRPGDCTAEIVDLVSLTESLDPSRDQDMPSLKDKLRQVIKKERSFPPSVLAQCNLTLLLLRRLRALDYRLSGSLLDEVLDLTSKATRCAQNMLDTINPWHHVANMPFQVLCILLVIDTPTSIANTADVLRVLSNVARIYQTDATSEALNTACLLVRLHQNRKEADARTLGRVLQMYSPSPVADTQVGVNAYGDGLQMNVMNQPWWLNDLIADIPNLQDYDIGQLLDDSNRLDMPVPWS